MHAKKEIIAQKETLYETYEQMLTLKKTVAELGQKKLLLQNSLAALQYVESYVLSGEVPEENIDTVISEMTGGEYTSLQGLQEGITVINAE